MIQTVLENKVPVKIWTKNIEAEALQQLENLASLPFIFKHVAVMPDVHWGLGATIGSVIPSKTAVIPAAVGVDIGCGMCAVKTGFSAADLEGKLSKTRQRIERDVPVGFEGNRRIEGRAESWEGWKLFSELTGKVSDLKKRALEQLGSLGGGNHFIEICLDTENNVWILLHSGSRHIGKSVADVHIHEAKRIMARQEFKIPDRDLAYFTAKDPEFKSYLRDVEWCQRYATENREIMVERIIHILARELNEGKPFPILMRVNCHHNYVSLEKHFGENVYVTRKGAVSARQGQLGIIPGSMGTASYIVEGLGNPESFMSCSHGAGRAMSRHAAKKKFTERDLEEQTKNVECRKDRGVLDEIPGAYKDIDKVMKDQEDLVTVKAKLKQALCVKG